MPKKFADSPTPDEKPSGVGSLRNWLAGGIRVGSGLLSGEGMIPGALISGAGEGLAELAEGSPLSMSRIGVEAGIGAIPLGKVFKAGHAVSSGLKSGALGAVGEAGREIAKGEELNPRAIATTGVVGGLTGGLLSKLLGMGGASKAAEKIESEIVPTAQTGQGTGVLKPGAAGKQKGRVPDVSPRGVYDTGTPIGSQPKSTEVPYRMEDQTRRVPIRGAEGVSSEPAPYRRSAVAAQKAEDAAAKEAKDLSKIQQGREEAGLTNENYSSSSTTSASGERFTTTYSKPAEEGAEGAGKAVVKTKPAPKAGTPTAEPQAPAPKSELPLSEKEQDFVNRTLAREKKVPATAIELKPSVRGAEPPKVEVTPTPPAPVEVAPESPETPLGKVLKVKKPRASRASKKTVKGFNEGVDKIVEEAPPLAPEPAPEVPGVLAKFFKTKAGATGQNYRLAQQAEKEGDIPSAALAREAHMRELAASKRGVTPNQVPTPPGPPNDNWISDELAAIDKIRNSGGQKGAISPAAIRALTGLSGAAIGAPIGAANSNEDEKLQGALKGAAIGGGIGLVGPSIIEAFQHPEGAIEGLSKLGHKLPSIQRANLLTSQHGLPANAVAGPWGSGVMGSVEHMLSGDPRGREALRHLGPTEMLNPENLRKNFNEAAGLIGRAEGTSLDAAASTTDKVLATPGTMMTTGDLTTRNALEKGGFTPDETREITMTNEPWTKSATNLARLAKGSPLLQFMFPFSRTTANIAEQGAKRIPVLGEFVENAMVKGGRTPDTLRTRLVQQGMGGAVMGGSGLLGANIDDPEQAKIVKRYLSNAAGQYSLPASIGFSAGQGYNKGKGFLSGGYKELADALPLPTEKPIQDVMNAASDLGDYAGGEKDFSQVRIPHSLYPSIAREIDLDEVKKLLSGSNSVQSQVSRPTTKKFID